MSLALGALLCAVLSPLLGAQQIEPAPIPELAELPSIPVDYQLPSSAQVETGTLPLIALPSLASIGPREVVIPRDMQVELRLAEGLSTVTDHIGYVVHLEAASDVVANGVVVVAAGTPLTVKLTHAGGRIEFSEPKLIVGGRKLRLSKLNVNQRRELSAEYGAAVGIAIFASPVIAVTLPIQAVLGVREAIRNHRKHESKRYAMMEKGQTLTYYVRDSTRVSVSGH
jgi:hypothetical protein